MLSQPASVSAFGMFGNFFQEVDRLRFETRLGRIIRWDHHLHIDGDNELSILDKSRLRHSLTGNSHDLPSANVNRLFDFFAIRIHPLNVCLTEA